MLMMKIKSDLTNYLLTLPLFFSSQQLIIRPLEEKKLLNKYFDMVISDLSTKKLVLKPYQTQFNINYI